MHFNINNTPDDVINNWCNLHNQLVEFNQNSFLKFSTAHYERYCRYNIYDRKLTRYTQRWALYNTLTPH